MSNKKAIRELAMFTVLGTMLCDINRPRFTPESKAKLRELRMQQGFESQPKNKGLKEFNIDGKIVWSINEKNAIRKSRPI